ITQHGDLFTPLDKKSRVFQRREDGAAMPHLPVLLRRHGVGGGGLAESRAPTGRSLRQSIEARVLERYAPAHVVVTREGDVINYSGGNGKFLGGPARAAEPRAEGHGAQGPAPAAALRAARGDRIATRRGA